MRINVLKTLKVITWRLKVVTFQGIKKNGSNFKVRVSLGLGFSMGFRRCSLSTSSSAPPLARASQRSFSFFYKMGPSWPHHVIVLHVLILLFLLHFVVVLHASLLLFVLHCSFSCFITLLFSMLHCSLCFNVPPTFLLFIVFCCCSLLFLFCCCSSCFAIVPTSLLLSALLFLLLCYYMVLCCSYFFATAWCFTFLSRFAILLPSQVPFYPLLFCCSYVFYCYSIFIIPLPRLVLPLFSIMWRFRIVWEKVWKHLNCQ